VCVENDDAGGLCVTGKTKNKRKNVLEGMLLSLLALLGRRDASLLVKSASIPSNNQVCLLY
jgi:hypothetical protein